MHRRIARLWRAAGIDVVEVKEPKAALDQLENSTFIGADEFDRDIVAEALQASPSLQAVLWTSEHIERMVEFVGDNKRVMSILGRSSFDAPPSDWEILMVARRLGVVRAPAPALSQLFRYGATGFEKLVASTEGLERAVERAHGYMKKLGAPAWAAEAIRELAHELLMNALYDAPVDEDGEPRFAHDRKAVVEVSEDEAPTMKIRSDGTLVAVEVMDRYGRLKRNVVFEGLARGLRNAEVDRQGGGAGLGMAVCHNASSSMVYDVIPDRMTRVTGFIELDLNRREFMGRPRSLHFFTPASASDANG